MGYSEYQIGRPGFSGVVRTLILVNIIVHILQLLPGVGDVITGLGAAHPVLILRGQIWRLFTYGFLHSTGSFSHLLFNMFGLWMFGAPIEARLGSKAFLWFYMISIVFSGLFSFTYLIGDSVPFIVGASGAIFAVVTLYAIYYPDSLIYIYGIIPVKARIWAIIFGVVSIFGTLNRGGDTAHVVHLGGIVFAFIYWKFGDRVSSLTRNWIRKRAIAKEDKENKKETVLHYYEPRKSRQEIAQEKSDIDAVLKKISQSGMESLSEDEYKILEKASGKPVERK